MTPDLEDLVTTRTLAIWTLVLVLAFGVGLGWIARSLL